MSSSINNSTLDLILEKLNQLEKRMDNIGSKKVKISEKEGKSIQRKETSYDDISILKIENKGDPVKIILITKNMDTAPVIEISWDEFMKVMQKSQKEHTKNIKFAEYKFLSDPAIYIDSTEGWILS